MAQRDRPVFDRGQTPTRLSDRPENTHAFEGFHRTAADRKEPRQVVTGIICGDPGFKRPTK